MGEGRRIEQGGGKKERDRRKKSSDGLLLSDFWQKEFKWIQQGLKKQKKMKGELYYNTILYKYLIQTTWTLYFGLNII